MNLKQYQYVIILAEEGSFSKAADKLHIAQPSLSQYIKKIETQVGFELFNRSSNEVELTEAGRIFLQAARAILNQDKQMRSQLADLADNHIGHLVVGIAPTRCQYLMPEIVRRFKAVFPGMHIVVEERFMKELMEDAERGVFDLCVATMPVDEQQFDITPMMREEVILAVPKSLPICDMLASNAKDDPSRIHPVIDIVRIDGAPYVALSDTQPTQRQLGELMGKYANLILVDDQGKIIDALKKIPPYENTRRTILPGARFELPEKQAGQTAAGLFQTAGRRGPLSLAKQ